FIDTEAEFIFVPPAEVIEKAKELDATPYDVHGVELTHDGEFCSFDAFLKKYKLDEPELGYLALIVRGADTDRHDLTPESGGLFAISFGLSDGSVATLQSRRDRLARCSFWTLRFAVYSNGVSLSRRSSCWRSAGTCAFRSPIARSRSYSQSVV